MIHLHLLALLSGSVVYFCSSSLLMRKIRPPLLSSAILHPCYQSIIYECHRCVELRTDITLPVTMRDQEPRLAFSSSIKEGPSEWLGAQLGRTIGIL